MISFIVAMAHNGVIGKDNDMPWHLPADLAHFKKVTSGATVVMGRKTYQSIGRPLPNRRNLILTKDRDFQAEGCELMFSKEEILEAVKGENEVFVIGGAGVFELFKQEADRLYITEIEADLEGDTFFPEIDWSKWTVIDQKKGIVDQKNQYPHTFFIYEKST